MTSSVVFSALSFIASMVIAVVVYSLKTTIRVAILEAASAAAEKYATKDDLKSAEARLHEQIALRREIRTGFSRLGVMRGSDATPLEE